MNIFQPFSQTILGDPAIWFVKGTEPFFESRERFEYEDFIQKNTKMGDSMTESDSIEPSKLYENAPVPFLQWIRDRQQLTISPISLVSGLSSSHADKYVDPKAISYVMLTENVTPSAEQPSGLSISQVVNPDNLKDHGPSRSPIVQHAVTNNTVPDHFLQHDDMAIDVTSSEARGVVQAIPLESPSISTTPSKTHHDDNGGVVPSLWKQLDEFEPVHDNVTESPRETSRRSTPMANSPAANADAESQSLIKPASSNEPDETPVSSPQTYSTSEKHPQETFDEPHPESSHAQWIVRSATLKAYEPAGVNDCNFNKHEMEHVWPKSLELGSNSVHMVRPSAYLFWQDQGNVDSDDMLEDDDPVTSVTGVISDEEYRKRLAGLKLEKERQERELEERMQLKMLYIQQEFDIDREAISQAYEWNIDELQHIWESQHHTDAQETLS
ncbi:hypothetical protein INT43_004361 [Umbelopsis isabellina]|uniref:Uncharacterized protein n=1 Tax=Mortierella isabellina TaxID=91625 RepID=A0A8H7UC00_MORIS|nr:hypothetical protein INT43_004361 [Umbelopsis isabellina]